MTDESSHGWSHNDAEPPLPLCEDHTPTTARLDNHRANQIARACLQCIARRNP